MAGVLRGAPPPPPEDRPLNPWAADPPAARAAAAVARALAPAGPPPPARALRARGPTGDAAPPGFCPAAGGRLVRPGPRVPGLGRIIVV
jgi:hypothetical protein